MRDSFTGLRGGEERFPGQDRIAQDLRNLNEGVTPVEDYFVVAHYGLLHPRRPGAPR